MEIQHRKINNRGMFFVEEEGEVVAQMVYSAPETHKMVIEHTEVDEDIQGQNIGYELVQSAVEYARTHHIKIVPVCSFAKAVFDKKPDFRDVLFQE